MCVWCVCVTCPLHVSQFFFILLPFLFQEPFQKRPRAKQMNME